MESSTTNNSSVKQIDGEALLESFNIKNKSNFPKYVKSIWKDLSRRSENSDKGFDKVIFSNYYDLPGIISTRLFNLLDKDKDGYLSYSEFSKGMITLFNSTLGDLMQFIFNFFDENKDGYIIAEDVRTIFQYIPLQKSNFSDNSFKDRLESQEELHEIISAFFKNKEKLDFNTFKKQTEKEDSTIFLYITVYLLTNKPFTDRTLTFYQNDNNSSNVNTNNVENSNNNSVNNTSNVSRNLSLIASPNLTSKFSPMIKILKSPIMKSERDRIRQELMDKSAEYKKTKTSGSYNASDNDKLYSIKSSDFVHMNKEDGGEKKNLNLLHPSRMEWKVNNNSNSNNNNNNNNNNENLKDIDILADENAELLDALASNIDGKDEAEELTHEGYLVKLVDDKLKKLWFTLYEKYLYCKEKIYIYNNIIYIFNRL